MSRFAVVTWELARTEWLAEWRSRQVTTTMALLTALVVVTFGFAGRAQGEHLAVAAFWVSLLLAAVAGTAQVLGRLEDTSIDEAWLTSGVGRTALLAGRTLALAGLLAPVALLAALLVALLFGARPLGSPLGFTVLAILGSLGLALCSTTVSLTLTRASVGSGQLMPLVLLAAAMPVAYLGAWGCRALATSPGSVLPPPVLLLALLDVIWAGVGLLVSHRARAR